MSKERPFEDIKPITKFNTATASKEELISYIEKLEKDLMSMNDTILSWIAKDKAEKKNFITVPIKVNYQNNIVIDGYYDKTRNLIFLASMTCELAKEVGIDWEEVKEQLRGD